MLRHPDTAMPVTWENGDGLCSLYLEYCHVKEERKHGTERGRHCDPMDGVKFLMMPEVGESCAVLRMPLFATLHCGWRVLLPSQPVTSARDFSL